MLPVGRSRCVRHECRGMTVASLVLLAVGIPTMTLHVDPNAAPNGDGSADKPYASLSAALERAGPGVRIELAGGTYPTSEPIVVKRSGAAGAWLVILAKEGQMPVLDGTHFEPSEPGAWLESAVLDLRGVSWVRVEGISVYRSPAAGIKVQEGCERIDLVGNTVDSTFGPGIALWNSSKVRALGNTITRANTQDRRLFGDYRREAPHEALSVAGIVGFEVAYNHVHHCTKEGIDVKEVSRDGIVHHNWVHDVDRQGLYVDAWFGELRDVVMASNLVQDAEWGMVLSAEGKDSVARRIAFRDNVVERTRGSGFFFGTWGGDGPREGVTLEFNTFRQTGQPKHWSGATGGIDLRSTKPTGVVVKNNLIVGAPTYAIAWPAGREAHVRFEGNAADRAQALLQDEGLYGSVVAYTGPGLRIGTEGGARTERNGRLRRVASPDWTREFLPFRVVAPHYPVFVRP